MNKTPVQWEEIEFSFKRGYDLAALERAITPPADVTDLSPKGQKMPLGWERYLQAWGWGCGVGATQPSTIGPYGDWTWLEDDVRLMALIAPFVEPGSRMVFRVGENVTWSPNPDFGASPYEAWEFDGKVVSRRKVERIVTYE